MTVDPPTGHSRPNPPHVAPRGATGILAVLRRFLVFSGGSMLGAGVDYAATLILSGLAGLHPEMALGLAMLMSSSIVFLYHERVTFPGPRDRRMRRYLAFEIWSLAVFALRASLLWGFTRLGLPLYIALLLAIGFASVVNFAISTTRIFAAR